MNSTELGKISFKEIYESPKALKDSLDQMALIEEIANEIVKKKVKRLFSTGSGSSYHSAVAMEYLFNNVSKLLTTTKFSPEFPYIVESIINHKDTIIGISQSGESKEAIYALEKGNEKGALTIAITNNTKSKLASTADFCIPIKCDKEVGVMATKTYVANLGILAALGIELAYKLNNISEDEYKSYLNELRSIPDKIENSLGQIHKEIKVLVSEIELSDYCFVLGAGLDYGTAFEGALKLIEGAHMFALPSSTAEFPHGPITLAESKIWTLLIVPPTEGIRYKHMKKLVKRLREKNTTIISISSLPKLQDVNYHINIPSTLPEFNPFVSIMPIQLLTLEISRRKGLNCDKPEGLSKVSYI